MQIIQSKIKMKIYISQNGTSEVKPITVGNAPELVGVLNQALNGEHQILEADGNDMLNLLGKLEVDTTRCMAYNVLMALKTEQKGVETIFNNDPVSAAIGLVALNKYHGGDIALLGITSINGATRAHSDFGASYLEESLKAGNTGKQIYPAARYYANQAAAQII